MMLLAAQSPRGHLGVLSLYLLLPIYLIAAVAYFWRSWYLPDDSKWQLVFLALAGLAVLRGTYDVIWKATVSALVAAAMNTGPSVIGGTFVGLADLLRFLYQWFDIIGGLPVLAVAVYDFRSNQSRDWLHWIGVLVGGKGAILGAAWLVLAVAWLVTYSFVRWCV